MTRYGSFRKITQVKLIDSRYNLETFARANNVPMIGPFSKKPALKIYVSFF